VTKIYLVTTTHWQEYRVFAAFSSRVAAKRYLQLHSQPWEEKTIETWRVNYTGKPLKKGESMAKKPKKKGKK